MRFGFTLIELLVVLAIVATLASLVAPQLFRNVGDARAKTARSQVEVFSLALDAYRLDNGVFPTTEQGLASLVVLPVAAPIPGNWRGPYLKRDVPLDPWGHAYAYREWFDSTDEHYSLFTLGRDARPGGSGEDADVSADGRPVTP